MKIDLLKNKPNSILALAKIWYEVLGKIWAPELSIEQIVARFSDHSNDNSLPLTLVAFENDNPIGMCSLRENDGILPELKPWLGSLVVDLNYQRRGIGKILVEATQKKAKELGFAKCYLFAFDSTIPEYYKRLGWKMIGTNEFKGKQVIVMECDL